MPTRKGRLPRSNYNSQKVAESWLGLGIRTVPIKKNGKAPKSRKGWNTLRITKKTIPDFFKPSDNVGGLWGEPSGWVIDVDLDWDEAAEMAALLLPATFVYGRASRPGTHFLYRCKGISSAKWTLRTGEVVAEIRSTGSQSVLPPSMHPEEERYEINEDEDFKTLSELQLRRYMSEVCIGAVLIREFPEGGSRHDYVHSITGALMWSGWDEKRVRRFMNAFLTITFDFDDDSKQRIRTVNNTIEHFKKGNRVAGWKTLSEWIDGKLIQRLREWSKVGKQLEDSPQGALLPPKKKAKAEAQFPLRLLNVPGLVGDIAKWSAKQSFLVQPSFDLAVGLMCTALATCNKYKISGWDTPLQPYFMLLAPTAAGKGASLTSIYRFAKTIGLTDSVFQGFQSYHAMLDRLGEPPNMVCWLWDEAARRLASARSPGSMDYQIVSWLISLYGKADEHVPGFPGRKVEIPTLDRPFLTLLATAQPSQLIESVTTTDLAMGLVNRFVLFDSGDGAPPQNWDRESLFPSVIRKKAMELKQHEPKGGGTTPITYENIKAYKLFDNFFTLSRESASRGDENEIWGRANQNALILAGLVAVGISPRRPQITEEIGHWAIEVIQWSIHCWMTRIGETASRNLRESQSKKVESLIRRPKALKTRKPKEQQLLNRGLVPRSVLLRSCRYLRSHELTDIMEQLFEADLVGMSEEDGHEVYWPKH